MRTLYKLIVCNACILKISCGWIWMRYIFLNELRREQYISHTHTYTNKLLLHVNIGMF